MQIVPVSVRRKIRSAIKSVNRRFRLWTASFRSYPDFILIGAQKSGTSTLYHALKQHPDVCMSFDKESKFFDRHYHKGLRWYRHQFPMRFWRNKCVGDNTPYYLFHPNVPERVKKLRPDVKLILILRNPVDRAYSHYQMERRKGREPHDTFEKGIENEEERIYKGYGEVLQNPLEHHHIYENTSYLSRGKYMEQIRRWLQYFPVEQLLILRSEWLFSHPVEGMKKVCDFLGIKTYMPENFKPYNVASYLEMNAQTRKRLEAYYEPYNKELEAFLQQNIA